MPKYKSKKNLKDINDYNIIEMPHCGLNSISTSREVLRRCIEGHPAVPSPEVSKCPG